MMIEERLEKLQTRLDHLAGQLGRLKAPTTGLRLKTFQDLEDETPFSADTLRHWQRTRPDFLPCLIQKGRRIYVDMDAFDRWLDGDRFGQYERPTRAWPE